MKFDGSTRVIFIVAMLVAAGCLTQWTASDQQLLEGLKATDAARVQAALSQGAKANIEYADGMTPLAVAVARNDHASAEALLRAGANPNVEVTVGAPGSPMQTVLALAEDDAMGKLLVKGGADPNRKDKTGETPLGRVVLNGNAELVKALLEVGADPNIRNSAGMTALDLANAKDQVSVATLLGEGGAEATRDAATARQDVSSKERAASGADALRIFTTDLTSDGRYMKIRGRMTNPFAAKVTGVRYRVSLLARGTNRRLDTFYEERDDTEIEPGGTAALRLDIATMYAGTEHNFRVEAIPMRIGDREIPEPQHWRQ